MPKIDLEMSFSMPPQKQIEYLNSLGIKPSANWVETAKTIAKHSFAVSGIDNMNTLTSIRESLTIGMSNGMKFGDLQKKLIDDVGLMKNHSTIVIKQNILNAFAYGRYDAQKNNELNKPYVYPVVMNDKRTTKICKYLHSLGKVCFRIDDPFLKYVYGPRHFACRTYFVSISETQRKKLGYKIKKCKSIPTQYRNAKSFQRLPKNSFKFNVSNYPKQLQDSYQNALNNGNYINQLTKEKSEAWLQNYTSGNVNIGSLNLDTMNSMNRSVKMFGDAFPQTIENIKTMQCKSYSKAERTFTAGEVSEKGTSITINTEMFNDKNVNNLFKTLVKNKWWVANTIEEALMQLLTYTLFYEGKSDKEIKEALKELEEDMFASELSVIAQKDGLSGLSEALTELLKGNNISQDIIDKLIDKLGILI